jgi:hypothetical protein
MQQRNQSKKRSTSIPDKTKTTTTRYNYNNVLKKVIKCGKDLYGSKFQVFEEDRATILKLLCWFLQDDAVANKEGLSLDKGILLTGPPGCGKSAIMKIICSICDPSRMFTIKSSPEIVIEFADGGYKVFDRYTVRSVCLNQHPRAACFDDLGSERKSFYYELHFNPLAEILLFRYEMFVEHRLLTHITTNLSTAELEERYGCDLSNCLSEMFNLVAFPRTSIDKRKL